MQPAMLTRVGGRPTQAACIFLRDTAYLIGAQARTPAGYQKYQAEIEAAIASFHALTGKEPAFAQPLRVRVITAQANTTFAELGRRSQLGRFAEGHLRVINGLYPAGKPVAGQHLKIME